MRLARRADDRDDAVDGNRLAFLDPDFGETPGDRRRNLGVDLVGRDLEERLVAIDVVADLLDPADDRALGDRLPHLGHHDIGGHLVSSQLSAISSQHIFSLDPQLDQLWLTAES